MIVKHKWWIFVAVALAIMMVDVDITAANLALATIAKDLGTGISTAQWIIDGYMVAAASLMAFGGRLSDIFGAKRIFIIGLSLFSVTSLAVGLSVNAPTIIVARILQGACIAFTFPVSAVIIRQAFPKEQQGFIIGLVLAIAGLSQALGPTFGAVIIHLINWRWIFLIDVPLALLSLLIILKTMPNIKLGENEPLSLGGVFLLVIGLLALMTGVNEAPNWGFTSLGFVSLVVLALIALVSFVKIEFRSKQPVLDLKLLLKRDFMLLSVVRLFFMFVYFTLLFVLSLFLQNIMGFSALDAGFVLLAMTLVFGVLSIPSGKVSDKIGPQASMIIGLVLIVISLGILFFRATDVVSLILALATAGVGIALTIPAMSLALMFSVPPEKTGAAMGVFFTIGFIGSSLGVAISGLLLSSLSQLKLQALITKLSLTGAQIEKLYHIASGAHPFHYYSGSFSQAMLAKLRPDAFQAFMFGFHWVIGVCFVLSVLAVVSTMMLRMPQ